MTTQQFLCIAVIVFGASIIQALFGFGFGLISVPLMIFFVDLPVAVVTATAVSTVSCSIQWYESRAISARDVSQRLVLSALLGMPFGLWLLNNLDPRLMKFLLGIFVFIGVFLSSRQFDLRRLPLTFDYSMAGQIVAQAANFNDAIDVTFGVRFDIVEPEITYLAKTWTNPSIA